MGEGWTNGGKMRAEMNGETAEGRGNGPIGVMDDRR